MDPQPVSGSLNDIHKHRNPSNQSNSSSKSLLERRQSSREDGSLLGDNISPMPTGAERMAALRDLGATFEEGNKSIAKVATPTETVVPSFVDEAHLEKILHQKKEANINEVAEEFVSH